MVQPHRRIPIFVLLIVIAAWPTSRLAAEHAIGFADFYDKMRGMWVGELIGNAAGRVTEGRFSGPTANPDDSVPWQIKRVWDGDDDTDIEYLALHILETHGFDCNDAEIAQQWRDHIADFGIYIANRQAWLLLNDGLLPPATGSQSYNIHWYAIDSQITTEVLGAVSPGLPQAAIDLAGRFGSVTNEGFPVHAAQFYAAMYSYAFFESDIQTLIHQTLRAIPASSRTSQVINDVLDWFFEDAADSSLDWRATRYRLYDKYCGPNSFGRYYFWVESTVNVGATVMALLYGRGDFKETVQIAVLAGWDCDCNPATAGGLIGIIKGFHNLPSDLINPRVYGNTYQNVYRPGLPDPNLPLPQTESISTIAIRMASLAQQNILRHGGYATAEAGQLVFHIPDQPAVTPEPERPDPNGPAGLVAAALDAGITVTPAAAVARYNPAADRENLSSIIDGITDNTYNGRRPYWSYSSNPALRPDRDWYQISFSRPVLFNKVTFYEGDVVWDQINEYYRLDAVRGGFFEDLTVEILKNGRFVQPADLQMSPALDRYRMYQTITFTFAPTIGDAVRVIGAPGGTERFTTIMELQAEGSIDPGPCVTAVEIADDQTQRSEIGNIQIVFSRSVSVGKTDLQILGTTHGTRIPMAVVDLFYDPNANRLYVFLPPNLRDDTYELRLNCPMIADPNGSPLLDDDSQPGDGRYTIAFHKLFGDADGSSLVDYTDLGLLGSSWLYDAGATGLDANNDGIVDLTDLAAFAENWRRDP